MKIPATALRERRGKGRNEYPVHVLWRTLLAASVLRHPTMDACLAAMSRKEGLRRVIGLGPADPVPNAWDCGDSMTATSSEPSASMPRCTR